jgi:sortase A
MSVRRVVAAVGRALIGAGVVILLFAAHQLWGTNLREARAQDDLRAEFAATLAPPATTTTTTAPGAPPTTAPAVAPTTVPAPPATVPAVSSSAGPGEAVAIIRIPSIGVDKVVVQGVGVDELRKGPGRYPGTPLPGEPGNAAIAGHRTTYGAPFAELGELVPGDVIDVTTAAGEFRYEVTGSEIVTPDRVDVLDPTPDDQLTLTTCHPRFSAAKRLIVRSRLLGAPAPAPAPAPPPPAPSDAAGGQAPADEATPEVVAAAFTSTAGDRDALVPALALGALAAGVWAAARVADRWAARRGRGWTRLGAWVVAVPALAVVLFLAFEQVARLLPSSV